MKKLVYAVLVLFAFCLTVQPVLATDYAKLRLERQYFSAITSNCEDIHTKNPSTATVLGFSMGAAYTTLVKSV